MIEMLFKAIGLTDDQIAEIRDMMDPEKVKAIVGAAKEEFAAIKSQLDRIETQLADIRAHQGLTEIVAHGGSVMHPNFQQKLDADLVDMAERGEVALVLEGEVVERDELIAQERAADNGEPLQIPEWVKLLKKEPENERRDDQQSAAARSDGDGGGSGGSDQ